ncbi:UDP-N-acetylmuramoyl-tripeptide--D-alanyl-D-alanine ligase [Vibrio sp. Of7-15]|uniref:UDP-N-acetylmuramoyl-tripeptide--D-alanyl-D- alanine ligase n=1 Tax=Vibrio sp. Of7-15 TaxID=2724879 RepID=UPI001EF2BE24|nr:UDP-N-acetylmuramoyl-tripeptide--D-alanyl-D-alanine ligase [Vibrio sp. Of7-15]MCG7498183.1 UDP-N-acetylmuramoyl-tripeptide--D-alanyl-D-alanine ligase [Vibrio sp. Of7-15]
MISVKLSQLIEVLEAELIGSEADIHLVSTDTRTIEPGCLFVALVGERFDAHNFCADAVEKGASALLVNKPLPLDIPQLVVKDTQLALGQLSAWVHQQCDTFTMALTGSCGKTTVKEMVANILAQKGQVLATAGNFNNEIGVPLTLLRSTPEDDFAVIELGANHQNEISYTTQLAQPHVALINNIAAAHLEGFGSLAGVAKAKGEIFEGLKSGGTAIVNLDSNDLGLWRSLLSDKALWTFALTDSQADFFASHIELSSQGNAQFILHSPQGNIEVHLPLVGKHNVANALAAAALALSSGMNLQDIKLGLESLQNVKGRVEVLEVREGLKVIDDSYNASVPAVKAATEVLSSFEGQRWLVLGYMAELGEESGALHRQIGEHAASFGLEQVITFGDDTKVVSELCQGQHFETREALISYLNEQLNLQQNNEVTVLVKGANSARMSEVVSALKESQ